MTKQVAKNYFP